MCLDAQLPLLDDSLHDWLRTSKAAPDMGSLAELHNLAAIATHRRVIHDRIVALVKGACEQFCPGELDNWKDLQMTSEAEEETPSVWMARVRTP